MHYLLGFKVHLHLLAGIAVIGECIDVGNEVESKLAHEFLHFGLFAAGNLGALAFKFVHAGGSGTAGGLIGCHMHPSDWRKAVYRVESHHHLDCGAVRIGNYVSRSLQSIGTVDFGHNQRHIGVHAESARIVNHYRAARCYDIGIFARHARSGRHKSEIEVGKVRCIGGENTHRLCYTTAEAICAACATLRAEETEFVYGKVVFRQNTQKFLPNGAGCAHNSYFHSF